MTDALSVPPCTAVEVANWFIQRGIDERRPCDQMKVHKLVYYAHAWFLGNGNGPLFEEDVEAWQYGPVVRSLYRRIYRYGMSPITKLIKELNWDTAKEESPLPSKKYEPFLERMWEIYGQWSGIALSNATHRDGEPWEIMYQNSDLSDKPIIRNSLIEQVFSQKVDELRNK